MFLDLDFAWVVAYSEIDTFRQRRFDPLIQTDAQPLRSRQEA
jgi:hypothetical protein